MTGGDVRRIRDRLGLLQPAFAKLVGVHSVTVSRWENGAMIPEPTARLIRLLAKSGGPKSKARECGKD